MKRIFLDIRAITKSVSIPFEGQMIEEKNIDMCSPILSQGDMQYTCSPNDPKCEKRVRVLSMQDVRRVRETRAKTVGSCWKDSREIFCLFILVCFSFEKTQT